MALYEKQPLGVTKAFIPFMSVLLAVITKSCLSRHRYCVKFVVLLLVLVFVGFHSSAYADTATKAVFPQNECDNPKHFSKTQRENIIYAYNFGAPRGMGYTMAAIAWQESCAGVYMVNFSDPSAGLYHAHIPVVLKYYSNYKDTPFTRNIMGQLLIDDKKFASKVALDSLLYWHTYHKGNYKNIIKSYNKGFKWEKDSKSNALAESYYISITKKIRTLESYIPRYSRIKNQSIFVEMGDKNKQIQHTLEQLKGAKEQKSKTTPKTQQKPTPSKQKPQAKPTPNKILPNDFVDLPLEGGTQRNDNFDENFEDFNLIFEG